MLDFRDAVGHEQVIEHLQMAITKEKISHAYIFNGEKGSGKRFLARTFAKTLLCEEGGTNPCGKCKSCMQAETNNHPDIINVTHEKVSLSVDDVRTQINQDIEIKPFSGRYKVYLVDDADKMTEQAQNAILKTIEEPPAYAVLILMTENAERLLPTIRSRCVILDMKPVSPELIKKHLMEERKFPDYAAEISARFSQGNMGRAIRYASSEDFFAMKEQVLSLLKEIDDMSLADIMEEIKTFAGHKLEINDYIDMMVLWYRDVLMFKVTNNPNVLLFKEEYTAISKQASTKSYEGIENIIKGMDKAKERLRANVNFDTVIELMLLTLKENGNGECDRS